ncbi:MAG: hypothetical protein Q27BPR15_03995 [Rhodobacter sp. CACIA14H1]|nr:MAG: hypothetical protein Q27BPR15_03995 [Rhodobacter sp. CACIA14H1]
MFRRLTRFFLTVALAGSLALTALSATRIALDPSLAPLREATASEIRATVDAGLARLSPDTIPAKITDHLAAERRDWVVLAALRDLSVELGRPLPPETQAAYDAAWAQDSGFWASAANCAACTLDPAACTLSTFMLCQAPVMLTPVGDMATILDGGIDYMAGQEVDRIAVALSIVGLGATATVVATGGTSAVAKLGASGLKTARAMGRLSPRMTALVTRAATDGVDWIALRRARSLDDVALSLRADAFAPLVSVAADLERIRGATDTTTALHLLSRIDDAADARRLANATEALGPRIVARCEVLGKTRLLRATVRVTGIGYALLGGLVTLLLSAAMLLGHILQDRLFAALRRKVREDDPHDA